MQFKESERLRILLENGILDTPPEADYDDVAKMAAEICGVPVGLVSFMDEQRQWFKAKVGVDFSETTREVSLCKQTIDSNESIFVHDTLADDRYATNPLVVQYGVRFYASAVVRCQGLPMGTVCAIDMRPHEITPEGRHALEALARHVGALLDIRRATHLLNEGRVRLESALTSAEDAKEFARNASRRFEDLFNGVPVACFTCDPTGVIYEWNSAAERLWGIEAHEAVQKPVSDVLGWPIDQGLISAGLASALRGEEIKNFEWEAPFSDGSTRWLMCGAFRSRDLHGNRSGAIFSCADITHRKLVERELKERTQELLAQRDVLSAMNRRLQALAMSDGLTGIANHRHFQEFLGQQDLERLSRRSAVSLILLDVDHFKSFNDRYGHPAGDGVLIEVGKILQDSIRDTDLVARYGGEEFAMVLLSDESEALAIAERVRVALMEHSWPHDGVTASFGVTTAMDGKDSRADMIRRADEALYAAKANGRNRVECWRQSFSAEPVIRSAA